MATLYKKRIMVKDKTTGERVPGETKKWYGRYRDALGIERFQPLAADKKIAQQMLNEIMVKVEKEKAGLLDGHG